ncbi:MAG: hypothetical protein QXU32_09430 [Nitrososphaerales archaeon]
MRHLADAVLSYVAGKEGKVKIDDIRDRFGVSKETLDQVIDFLVDFGFMKTDRGKKYVTLSQASKKLFEEES